MGSLLKSDVDELLGTYAVTTEDAARLLHRHPATIRRWVRDTGMTTLNAPDGGPGGHGRLILTADLLTHLGIDPETGAVVNATRSGQLVLRVVGE